jgi:hypothetical protein
MLMEAFTVGAVSKASHCSGFEGCTLIHFLQQLIKELQEHPVDAQLIMDVIPQEFHQLLLPFLSVPCAEWPGYIGQFKGTYFGNLSRALNKDRVDFKGTTLDGVLLLSGECKDLNKPLSTDVMSDILLRIPLNTNLHLVITNRLQKTYYSRAKIAFDDLIGQHSHLGQCTFMWIRADGTIRDNIPGLANSNDPKTLVVFVEV